MRYFQLLCLSLLALPTWAEPPKNMSDAEWMLLPEYCQHVQGRENPAKLSPRGEYWYKILGDDLWHIHHYCYAQIHWSRAHKHGTSKMTVNHLYEQVVAEIGYILRTSQPNMVLLPEVHHRSGLASVRLKKYTDAIASFEKAIKQKQDYWPSYVELAEVYLAISNTTAAKEVLEMGKASLPADNPRILALQKTLKM
jgi:tetratricopeptide (TPR) repeat protein